MENTYGLPFRHLKRQDCLQHCWHRAVLLSVILLAALLLLPGIVSADGFVGGIPLSTVQTGTVTGDLYIDATPPDWAGQGVSNITKTFTLPENAVGNITWAWLYVSAYCGHMQGDKDFHIINRFDGDGDGTYEQVWNEPNHAPFNYVTDNDFESPTYGELLGNDNTALGGGAHDRYKMINDHENRVTSDYFMGYDVTDQIKSRIVTLNVDTYGSYDGRTKIATLVVAYNNSSSATLTHYWVNQGHDPCTYYPEKQGDVDEGANHVAVGTTTFSTADIGSSFTSATLVVNHMASHNGKYAFPGTMYEQCYRTQCLATPWITFDNLLPSGINIQGPYSGVTTWDVTNQLKGYAGENAVLSYARDVSINGGEDLGSSGYGGFYKIPLAFLIVKSPVPPAANFTANVMRGNVPLTVQYTDTSTASPLSWNWDFGDSNPTNASVQNPIHTYTSAGNYTVRLTATNAGGSDTITRTGFITVAAVSAAPLAAFTAMPVTGTAPLAVTFADQSTRNVSAWAWDFGDGDSTNASVQSPVHTYAADGTFTVNLTVTGPGGTNSSVKSGYISVTPGSAVTPTATVTVSPTVTAQPSGTPVLSISPQTQEFGVGESRDYQIVLDQAPDGLSGYDLVLSLATPGVAEITNVVYPSWANINTPVGTPNQSVLLQAADGNKNEEAGATGILLATVTVKGVGDGRTSIIISSVDMDSDKEGTNHITPVVSGGSAIVGNYAGPVASFSANVTSGVIPFAVQFTDTSSNSPTLWSWDFDNDGVIDSTVQNPSVIYNASGTYSVNLTVAGSTGSDTITKTGYITATTLGSTLKAPVARFTNSSSTPLSGTVPLSVSFLDQSENMATSWLWDFGDGGTSSEKNPIYTYQSANTYTVTLTATNAAGSNTSVKTGYVIATAVTAGAPVASFTSSTTSGTVPLTVTFTDTSTGTVTSRLWDFGDGTTSRLKTPTNTFSSPGIFPVTLTVANSHGSNTATQVITVNTESGKPGVAFTATPLSGAYPLTVQFTDQSSDSPSEWSWNFGDGGTSTEQNPSHKYTAVGTYSVTLTAKNTAGSTTLTKSDYISVTQSSTAPDLSISNIVPNLGGTSGGTVFALKDNKITLNILNTGTAASTQTTVKLSATDWSTGSTTTVPVIAAGGSTTVLITDPTIRSSQGGTVTYTATVDPEKTLGELSETNNTMTNTFPVLFDGYAGKKYWTAGADRGTDTDVVTKHTYDLHGGVAYSRGDSVYRSGSFSKDSSVKGWLSYDVLWTTSDMSGVPSDATIKAAYLYVPYTWDNEKIVDNGHTSLTFNGNSVSQSALYTDKSNFGTWADYEYGLLTYDVTSSYKQDAENTATFTRSNPKYSDPSEAGYYTKLSMYEFYLVVVYEDSSKTRKQIFINDGFDLLGASDQYGTSEQEATAYIPFTGMNIDKTNMQKATLYTFVPAGDSHEGNLLYNGNVIASNVWDWGGSGTGADGVPQVAVDTRDVTSYIQSSGNTFGIQSTLYNGNGQSTGTSCMAAAQQILIVDMGTTSGLPSVDFYGSPTSGTVSLSVTFTDSSTNSPTSWYWYFGDGGTSTSQNPTHTYTTAGTYTVSLTAKNDKGSASTTKTEYITVRSSSSSTTSSSTSTSSSTHIENSEGGSGSSGSSGGQSGDGGGSGDGSSGQYQGSSSSGRFQAGPLEKSGSSGSSGSGNSGEEGAGPDLPSWLTELVLGALVVIGAGGAVAHVKGYSLGMIAGTVVTGAATWQKGFRPFMRSLGEISWDGPEHPSRTIDPETGLVRSGEGSRLSLPRWWLAAAIIAIVLIAIAVVAGLGLLGGIVLPFGDAGSNGSFDVIPTVENIQDLDTTNHVPDYPAEFSAHNGILFVYSGNGKIPLEDLEVDLKKGTAEVDLTDETVPPSKNAVNSRLSSYFEEEGNGDGTLDPEEWLMVYADNCYDSTQANDMPRGKILTWQPVGASMKIEVPLGDTIDYRIKNRVTGTTLQEGTLDFVPSSS